MFLGIGVIATNSTGTPGQEPNLTGFQQFIELNFVYKLNT